MLRRPSPPLPSAGSCSICMIASIITIASSSSRFLQVLQNGYWQYYWSKTAQVNTPYINNRAFVGLFLIHRMNRRSPIDHDLFAERKRKRPKKLFITGFIECNTHTRNQIVSWFCSPRASAFTSISPMIKTFSFLKIYFFHSIRN